MRVFIFTSLLTLTVWGTGCHHGCSPYAAAPYAPAWGLPYDGCVDCAPVYGPPAPPSLGHGHHHQHRQQRDLRRWYRQLNRAQRHHGHHHGFPGGGCPCCQGGGIGGFGMDPGFIAGSCGMMATCGMEVWDCADPMMSPGGLVGGMHHGQVYGGQVYGGQIYDGQIIDGQIIDGGVVGGHCPHCHDQVPHQPPHQGTPHLQQYSPMPQTPPQAPPAEVDGSDGAVYSPEEYYHPPALMPSPPADSASKPLKQMLFAPSADRY